MPIKIPKGFPRRKSSGNVLDEAPATEPSFKVFTRPNSEQKSVDMNLNRQKPLPSRKNSFDEEDDDLFTVMRPDATNRGSGGTANSLSTAPYDSGASSTRLSSASTNPSSIDARSEKNVQSSVQPYHTEPSAPPPPVHQHKSNGFLRHAGRTLSFGVKQGPEPAHSAPPPVPAAKARFSFSHSRDRAPTVSTVSTTTAPRLLESDLTLENSELDFGNMFEGIGGKSREPSPNRTLPSEDLGASHGRQLWSEGTYAARPAPPHPVSAERSVHTESSPFSWNSDNSRDGLMQTPSSVNTVVHNSPRPSSGRAFGKPLSHSASLQQVETSVEDNMFADSPSRVRAYSRSSRQNVPPPSSFPIPSRHPASSHSNKTTTGTSIQNPPIPEKEDVVFDPTLLASAALASQYEQTKDVTFTPATRSKKVMTPAQFERYKQQQDERHRMNKVFHNKHESDESDDNYDDVEEDDDAEHDRQVAKQRRKQEAHLAVYRQTMMKVTGEGSAPPPMLNTSHQPAASQSATDLANQFSAIGFDRSPARSSEDEDDDVPLGILAAHGFPNKNRPPNRLATSTSNPNLRGVVPPQPGPSSVAGESAKRGSLPVFARHLPEDPYYGASLVNQSNRESMAMNSPSNFVPSGASTVHPHHPAGLVGVIAGEERARAMRRGSPNAATGTYDMPPPMPSHPGHPSMPRSQTTGSMPNLMVPGMPGIMGMPGMPPMPGMLSPGDHAQIQMSQQMTQMMQMQMQWMQQMQQLMANQGQQGGIPQMNQIPQMPQMPPNMQAGVNMQRPQSVPLQGHPAQDQRTMSMLAPPSTSGWNKAAPSIRGGPQSVYAPSIAPSERSNIGLASRYRPVSTVQEPEQPYSRRASTMTSTTFRPWSQFGGNGEKQPASTVRKVVAPADDEDDEQGWAEMKAKKDQKKKTWKLRKGQNVLQELYNGTS